LGSHLYEQYLNLLKDATGKQFITNESVVSLKYNLIMTTSFIMLIERKKEKFNDSISINAVGFTGSILVKTHHQLKALEDVRIVKMLEDVC
jgi:ATP adenylyltransferase